MANYPNDGSTFVTETIERTAYRWAKYKPDGARQMGKPGRWQKQVWSCDYFRWENCDDPIGEICQPFEDGPISSAFKAHASLTARVEELEAALDAAASIPREYETEYAGRTYYRCTSCDADMSEGEPHDANCAWKVIDATLNQGGGNNG